VLSGRDPVLTALFGSPVYIEAHEQNPVLYKMIPSAVHKLFQTVKKVIKGLFDMERV